MDWFLRLTFRFFFLVFLLFFKFFLAPGIVAHAVVGDGAGIDDDAVAVTGLKLHLAEVERGGLQGVDQESGDFRIELPGEARTTCMSATWTESASSSGAW
jgi:hypothetical protein